VTDTAADPDVPQQASEDTFDRLVDEVSSGWAARGRG